MSAKSVKIGTLRFGEGVLVQSMTNTKTSDAQATIAQILALERAGCDVVRVSVPDEASADAISEIKGGISCPLVADIHFDYKLALRALERGADKVRINPGNIGAGARGDAERHSRLAAIVDCAKEHGASIRVGVNAGSLEQEIEREFGRTGEALARSALRNVRLLEDLNFDQIVISVKASDVRTTIDAYRRLSALSPYPLHLGVTEAGTRVMGTVKSDIALGSLLADGIGDTIRVSLAGDPVREVYAAKRILRALGFDRDYVEVVACPTCSRTCIPVEELATRVEEYTKDLRVPMKVAVMGCVVNGIGESKGADFGIAGGKGRSALFSGGEVKKSVSNAEIFDALKEEIDRRAETLRKDNTGGEGRQ